MKCTISVTHDCNLACSYCYGGRKFKKEMAWETARKVVDFCLRRQGPAEKLEFGFFGGEPLLRFDLIHRIVDHLRKECAPQSNGIDFTITTNGTLLTREKLDFFRQENIGLCISIDGRAPVHDRNRRFKNGKGTFNRVVANLRLAVENLNRVQVNAVYSSDTVADLADTVDLFINLGVPLIHLNPDILLPWDEASLPLMEKSFSQVAERYIASYLAGREVAINQIDSKVIVFLKGGYGFSDRCGMGEKEWGFAPSGNIYPCERFIGEDSGGEFCLGNVHTGLNVSRQCSVLKGRGNCNPECRSCSFAKYCMNWCGCTNHFMTGNPLFAASRLCANERATIRAAQQVLSALKSNDLFLDHFYQYLSKERHADQTHGQGGMQCPKN